MYPTRGFCILNSKEKIKQLQKYTSLVQGLNSTDPVVQEKAISDTEKRLHIQEVRDDGECKTKLNRTVVNSQDVVRLMISSIVTNTALEKDAKERAKRRKKNERLANALKEKGNDAFSKGDYGTAIQRYTEGLEKQKDMQVLYTNRAQAHMKLQEYKKVINDCEWALKVTNCFCNEKCIKAYFHMGKAHLALKDYNESRKSYQKILEIDPQKENCMNEVDLQERKAKEEEKALKEFQSGKYTAVSVKELLQKLNRPDQNILYYAGGIRVLTESIKDCTEQTVFRTNNGFSIISDNKVIRRTQTFSFSEENQRLLLTHPDVNVQLPMLLSSDVPEIQKQSLALLSLYSQTENGRSLLVRHQNLTKYCILLESINSCTLAIHSRRITYKKELRLSLVTQEVAWPKSTRLELLDSWTKFPTPMPNKGAQGRDLIASEKSHYLFSLFIKRAIGVLSRILPASSVAVEEAVTGGVVKRVLRFLKAGGQTTSCYAIKTLAVCTQSNSQAQEEVVKSDKKFDVLLKLLASENEMLVGNAAFCLSKCFEVPGAASSLLNSNIVMILLKHAGGEAKKTSVQENAAVALGKLCTAEPRHIIQLRELNGMAILNSSMKYVQDL
uniref:Tetratricopeptide repeat domain 12 n=1 Tax=Chelydra serpentina TaxID=8475 RepID=A0A8C3SI90_CHESE